MPRSVLIAASRGIICAFFFNDTATTEIYTLSLHDALPIWVQPRRCVAAALHRQMVMKEMPPWLTRANSASWACLQSKQSQRGRGLRGHANIRRSGGPRRADCHKEDWRMRSIKTWLFAVGERSEEHTSELQSLRHL